MLVYIKGILFIIGYIFFNYLIGTALLPDSKSAPKRFVVGYICFAAIIAIGGIPIQLLNLTWNMFFIYFLVITIFFIVFSVYRIYKKKIKLFNGDFYVFIKQYWFLFFLAGILVLLSTINIGYYWMNNCLDDGYYLNRMATLPFINQPFAVIPGTGLIGNVSFTNSYNYNVFELEASVYIYLLNILPTFFARFCLAFINYFLFACVSYCFFEKLNKVGNFKINEYSLQYMTIYIIIFSFCWDKCRAYNLHQLQDGWQNATAMYYGSSIVRSMGLIMLIAPFIDKNSLKIRDVFRFGIISLVLMSKSSIALPVIIISALSIICLVLLKNEKTRKVSFILIALMIGFGFVLGDNQGMAQVYRNQFFSNIKSIIILCSIILICITLFLYGKSILLEVCGYIALLFGFTLLEPINNIFEKFSIFDFVACRFLTGIFIFVILLSTFCIAVFVKKVMNTAKIKYYVKNMLAITLSIVLFFSGLLLQSNFSFSNLNNRIITFKNNKYFAPQSVIVLGDCLENLAKEKNEKLYAIMPEGIGVEGITYSLAISIRQFSPSTVSLSAYNRYPGTIEKEFQDYSADNQKVFDDFLVNKSRKNIRKFKEVLDKYPINCVITTDNFDDEMENLGMKKYTAISYQISYYIYYR